MAKKKEVVNLVRGRKQDNVSIKETKLKRNEDFAGTLLWGSSHLNFSFRPSRGAAGGILTMWDSGTIEVDFSSSFENVIVFGGRLKKDDMLFSG